MSVNSFPPSLHIFELGYMSSKIDEKGVFSMDSKESLNIDLKSKNCRGNVGAGIFGNGVDILIKRKDISGTSSKYNQTNRQTKTN